MRLKVSSAKQRPFCLGLNVLNALIQVLSVTGVLIIKPKDIQSMPICFQCIGCHKVEFIAFRQRRVALVSTELLHAGGVVLGD